MKKLLLVLVPMLLLAQVEVDTVVHLPAFVINGHFIPEINKLYLTGWYEHIVLDCSTYQVRAEIPRSYDRGRGIYSWNWRRRKLYIAVNPYPDSLVIIDGIADTLLGTLLWSGLGSSYVASNDRLYRPVADSFGGIDCASDTLVRGFRSPLPGYGYLSPSWDSVGNKLYVSLSAWGQTTKVAVYDCTRDSLLTVIDLPSNTQHIQPVEFDYARRKGYFVPDGLGGHPGVIDTRRDVLVKSFPFTSSPLFGGVALDTLDHKAYFVGSDTVTGHSALYVVDCATDSIIKVIAFPVKPWPVEVARWVPWSNRVYLTRPQASANQGLGLYVVDCQTDSIIVSDLVLGYWPPFDFQIDPIRERVFAIGCESTSVHVLRDVEGGVAESPEPRPAATATARFCASADGVLVEYQLPAAARVRATLHDAVGRQVGSLDAGEQMAGIHRLRWDRDEDGRSLSAGTYFVLLDMGTERSRLKAVVK